MATLGQLKTRIAEQLHRSDLSARIASAVSDAIAGYQSRRFAFNQTQDTFVTVAGTEYYDDTTIPTDIAQIDSIRITGNGLTSPMTPAAFSWIETVSTNANVRGRPGWWAWYRQQIRLYPIPDAVYTITLAYLQKLAEPANDAASNSWTEEAGELIRCAAMRRLMRIDLRDHEGAAAVEIEEQRHLRRLLKESQMLVSGPLVGSM